MAYTITDPVSEPLTLAETKEWLKVEHSQDDTLITGLIKGARAWANAHTGRCFVNQTVTEYFDYFPADDCLLRLSVSPVKTLTSVEYIAESDDDYTVWPGANYFFDKYSAPARLVRKSTVTWPETEVAPNTVRITYVAGTDTAPSDVKAAMFLWVAFHYENREDMPVNETRNPRIRSATAILDRYKVWVI